jgi:general secretion pathway protein J
MTYFSPKRVPILPNRWLGFTLIELLVALAIFAVIVVMAYGGLNTVLQVHSHLEQQGTQLAQLQIAFTWLERDIEQLIDRPIRDEYGDKQPAIQGTLHQLELTRAGWRNPAQQPRSTLQRVAYQLEDKILWRSYWQMLDRAQDSRPLKVDLLSNITELKLRYLESRLQWHEQWPPAAVLETPAAEINNQLQPTLKAIEVTFTVVRWGQLTRLFRVPEG